WNGGAETILGYNSQEVVGRPLTDAIPDSTGGDGPNLMEVLRRGDRVQGYQARYRRKSGQTADLSITVSPILDPDGKPAGASIIARDVTLANRDRDDLQRTLTDLERSNRELEQFAYVASHDLQEPLRAVAGCVQILAKRYQTKLDNSAHELITHAVDGSQRMQTLIHDLLALSRVGSRGGKLTPVDSQAACQQAVKNLAIAVAESGAVIRFDKLPLVLADQTQLVQLFQNLIGNAMKYRGAREPRIEVTAGRTGDFWEFIVQDNGIGIESQYFERIFGVFQRLHTRLEYPGTGIGLAICKKIAERHGGRIWVESTPGVGTTMHFTLPAPT
ncbi:MAG TPA: ATP-binding protein, partial [Candidatus Limnocylindria bacterium]|nr:ATP-binding protein [Candidatus Limnocylindria bacterium]